MNFIDNVTVIVRAGSGGKGRVSFRHEKFIDRGGPDGGDGGKGGNIILVASRNQNTLARFRFQKELRAESGEDGGKQRKHGKSGGDLLVDVPVGTITSKTTGEVLADLTEDGQQAIIAHGGEGGFGNAHFVSSTRQAPKFAEKGEAGEELTLRLELKMIADVGLVGLPNAGKSTLLARISNARPEIADYPFTTLTPNLGVVDIDDRTSLLFADIPGLIEGASEGKGLGHEFLRHIERTAVLLHLIDAYQGDDVVQAYRTIMAELYSHSPELASRPEIVVLNKVDGLDEEIVSDLLMQLKKVVPKNTSLLAVSAKAGTGINDLLFIVSKAVTKQRQEAAQLQEKEESLPTHTLPDYEDAWTVVKVGGIYKVSGKKIERFAERTDFSNEEAVQRLRTVMQKMGIMHELIRQGIESDDPIQIASYGRLRY